MNVINRNFLILALCLVGLTAVPMALAGWQPSVGPSTYLVVLIVEVVVYFVVSMLVNARVTVSMAAGTAIVYTITRWICSLIGVILYGLYAQGAPEASAFLACVNPISAVAQAIILLMAGPYILALAIPELIGRTEAESLLGKQSSRMQAGASARLGLDSIPSGGFIQVFSFEELAALIRKSPGLEGFIVHSAEGLVVWRDLPMQVNVEVLTARISSESLRLGQLLQENGLTRVRRLVLESREHYLFATMLNQNFGIIMLFNGRSSPEEIYSRIAVLAKTAREFLQWKFPSLPAAGGPARDKLAYEYA